VAGLKILFQKTVDGQVYAQPLCVLNQLVYKNGVSQGKHPVVIVATEHGSVYAFNAKSGTRYWQVSLLDQGDSPVQASDGNINCNELAPEISITATPVIDRHAGPNGRIFVVVMETDGLQHYNYKLHALDLATGQDALTPVVIVANVSGNGPGDGFIANHQRSRSALLLSNGVIYTAFGAFCDLPPYSGWVLGYRESDLSQAVVFNDNPNGSPPSTWLPDGSGGGIWQAGLGPATDNQGNIYVATGNGPFDQTLTGGFPTNQDYGDSVLKFSSTNGLSVSDYFTPYNQQDEANNDLDLSAGGVVVLPDIVDTHGTAHHLMVVGGKDTNLYLLDRDNLGKFNASTNNIYQEILGALGSGAFSSAAFFNNSIYVGGINIPFQRFQFDFSNPNQPLLGTTPAAQTSETFQFLSCTPSISSNGKTNGIVWAYEYNTHLSHAVLHAFDAITLSKLYDSGVLLGPGVKFAVPTVFHGRVYVGTSNSLVAFGL
jgi:outer membrane protein assembly factor BamB